MSESGEVSLPVCPKCGDNDDVVARPRSHGMSGRGGKFYCFYCDCGLEEGPAVLTISAEVNVAYLWGTTERLIQRIEDTLSDFDGVSNVVVTLGENEVIVKERN